MSNGRYQGIGDRSMIDTRTGDLYRIVNNDKGESVLEVIEFRSGTIVHDTLEFINR